MIFSKCKTLLSALHCKRQNSPAAVERHRHFFLFIKKCVDTSKECAGETEKVQKSPKNSFSIAKGFHSKLFNKYSNVFWGCETNSWHLGKEMAYLEIRLGLNQEPGPSEQDALGYDDGIFTNYIIRVTLNTEFNPHSLYNIRYFLLKIL